MSDSKSRVRCVEGQCELKSLRALTAKNQRLRAALRIAAQWVPLPSQAYTPEAKRDADMVQEALEDK